MGHALTDLLRNKIGWDYTNNPNKAAVLIWLF